MSVFRHSREIPADPKSVFAAFQDPARLARWWGPDGFTNTFHTFEFRQGGSWLFTMHGPDGADYPNQSEFLEIVPGAMVRIKHVNLPHFELSISLEPNATGTLVSWVQVFENQAFAEKTRQFLETANEQNLNRLAREVAAGMQRGASSRNLVSISPFFIVKDLQTSIAFYRERLGFQLDFQGPEDIRRPYYAGVSRDGVGIMLKAILPDVLPCPNHTRHEWARWDAYIYTLNPDALFEEFNQRGVSFVKTLSFIDEGLWGFEITDADGYVLAFFQLRDAAVTS